MKDRLVEAAQRAISEARVAGAHYSTYPRIQATAAVEAVLREMGISEQGWAAQERAYQASIMQPFNKLPGISTVMGEG